ncbi:ArnT family glycosyltransferase [Amycolatopsis minnesotensis]
MVTTGDTLTTPGPATRTAFARLPVFLVAGVTGALLLIASRNYGYFFDEAYFVVAGRDHLALGYFDQPPLVPFLAGTMDHLFPGSLLALRLPATLAAVGAIVLTALIARELGGRRFAQTAAALAYALAGTTTAGHYLATYTVDPVFWALIIFLLVRWTRERRDGAANDWLLFWAGVVTAFSLETKFLVAALWIAVAVSSLAFGPRELVRRPLLWLGALVSVVATLPTLWWQAGNDWPYLKMSDVVAKEFPGAGQFLWDALSGAGWFLGAPLALFGLARLLGVRSQAHWRYLGVVVIGLVIAFLIGSGRAYYVYALYALPLAAGAVGLQEIRWPVALKWAGGALAAVSIAKSLIAIPIYPASVAGKLPESLPLVPATAAAVLKGDTSLDQVSQVMGELYQSLPPEQRAHTAIMTDSYVFAASIDLRHEERGLPRAYSGHRAYYYFGHPPESADSVLYFGSENPKMATAFAGREPIAPGFATLYTGRLKPWDQTWPKLRIQ